MATWFPIQANFNYGEISRLFDAQQDSDIYQKGLQMCRNMVPLSQGAVTTRPGTRYINAVPGTPDVDLTDARILPLEINSETYGIVALGGGQASILSEDNFKTDLEIVENGTFISGKTGWTTKVTKGGDTGYASINADYAYGTNCLEVSAGAVNIDGLDTDGYASARIRQAVTMPADATQESILRVKLRLLRNHDFPVEYDGGKITLTVGTTGWGSSDLASKTFKGNPSKFFDYSATLDTLALVGGESIYIQFYTEHGTLVSQEDISYTECNIEHVSIEVRGLAVESEATILPTGIPDEDLDDIQYVTSPYEIATVMVHENWSPHQIRYDVNGWVYEIPTWESSGGTPPDWSDERGWPQAVGAYQGRIFYANTESDPQSVWASASGDWYDINLNGTTASDPLWFTLSQRGDIQWIHGHKMLLLGTPAHEIAVTAQGGVLQANDVSADIQTSYGSSNRQPKGAAEGVFAVGGDKLAARSLALSRDIMGWKAGTLTWTAPHITNPGVRRVANARDPYRVVWLPLYGGDMAAMSYEPATDINGWSRHRTQGEFVDALNIVNERAELTFFIVRRPVPNEADRFFIEVMEHINEANDDPVYLDSYIKQNLGDPATTVPGLEHLNGLKCGVIVDGAVHPDRTVVNGTIELEYPGSIVTVGLRYTASMMTLPAYSPPQVGGLGARKSWSQIGVRMLDSPNPLINGVRVEERHPATDMDRPEPGTTGQVTMVETGYDEYGRILIEQDLPLPLTVTGVFGQLSVEDV